LKDNDAIEVAQDNEESIDQLDQNHVVIKLLGNDPDIFGVNGKHFKMKQTTNMGRLFDYYNEKYNIPESMLKFFFDGARIHYNDTPEKLGIKNNDLVQACLEAHEQTGKENSFIKIKAVYSDDTLLRFKVRPRTKFRKLKKHYSEFVGVPVDYLRFLFFETTINDDDTPEKLKMKNEVVIEVISDRRAPLSSANF
jgi:small ubiquitin-related modifier